MLCFRKNRQGECAQLHQSTCEPFLRAPHALEPGYLPFRQDLPEKPTESLQSDAQEMACGVAVTSLVADETSSHPKPDPPEPPSEPLDTVPSLFRHSGWQHRRKRLYSVMKNAGLPPGRLTRFAECGCQAFLWVSDVPGGDGAGGYKPIPVATKIQTNACRDRWCVPCATDRARLVAGKLMTLMRDEPVRFITLTTKSTDDCLSDRIDDLYKCYARLRRNRLWMSSVSAAAATLEVTRNHDTGRWHPHLHVIAKGKYIKHDDLRALWHRITGDSFIVDIRYVRDQGKAASYITTYITKTMNPSLHRDEDSMRECIQALKGRRMILLTGEWYGLKIKPEPDGLRYTFFASLQTVIDRALRGDPESMQLLRLLNAKEKPCQPKNAVP